MGAEDLPDDLLGICRTFELDRVLQCQRSYLVLEGCHGSPTCEVLYIVLKRADAEKGVPPPERGKVSLVEIAALRYVIAKQQRAEPFGGLGIRYTNVSLHPSPMFLLLGDGSIENVCDRSRHRHGQGRSLRP